MAWLSGAKIAEPKASEGAAICGLTRLGRMLSTTVKVAPLASIH